MKIVIQLLILLSFISGKACDCSRMGPTQAFTYAEFVGHIRITKNYLNEGPEEVYQTDIEIIKIYKGQPIKNLFIYGRSDGQMGSSCSIFIKEGAEFIVYASRGKNGNYYHGMCHRSASITEQPEVEILEILKRNEIDFNRDFSIDTDGQISSDLERFKGISLEKDFGLYQITFSSNLDIKEFSVLSGFGTDLDHELEDIFRSIDWRNGSTGEFQGVPENTKLLYAIYYYPPDQDSPSFISRFYVF